MDQSAHLATMRLAGQVAFAYLSVYKPDPIAEFTLASTLANGATALAVSYTVGSENDTRQGYYIRFYDGSSGAFKGDSRVRNSGARTSASLPVRELAYGHAKLSSGDVGKVYAYVQMDTKLVDATAQFNPDGEPYSDEGLHPPPCVNFGSHWAGWVDPTAGYALVTGKGSRSFLVDPSSATPVTHLSTAHPSSGIAFHSGSANTDANPVFEVSPGQYSIEHVGLDPDNGRVGTNNVVFMAHDPDTNPPLDVFLPTPPVGDPVNGWSWTVELINAADLESIWDGALCILWVDEYIGGIDSQHQQSFRGNNDDRSHIIGIGYARRDTSTGNAQDGDRLTMEIQSPMARIAEIASYSNIKQNVTVPAGWSDINTMGVLRVLISLKQNYTWIQEAGYDFLVHALYVDAGYPAVTVNRSDIISQFQELAGGRKSRFVNKWRGAAFELQPHPAYLSMSDRDSVTVNSTLTDDDILGYSVIREHQDSLEIFELQGITAGASGNTSAYARFPGLSPGGGKAYTTQGKYIPDSQTTIDEDAAMMGAYIQQIFIDSNNSNAKHRVGEMTLDLPGAYGYFDFDLEYTKFNYSGDLRGIDYSLYRCWLKRFQTTVDENTGEWAYQAVFQQETGAPADGAQTFVPDDQSVLAPPVTIPNLPPITAPDNLGSTGLARAAAQLFVFDSTNSVVWAWSRASQTWTQVIDLAALGMSGTLVDATWRVGGNIARLFTTAEARRLSNYSSGTPALGTAHALTNFTAAGAINYERSLPDWGIIASYKYNVGLRVAWTTDDSTWTQTTVTANYDTTSGTAIPPGLWVDPHTPGHAYITVYTNTATGGSLTTALYATTNYGSSWSLISNPAVNAGNLLACCLMVPYPIADGKTVYYTKSDGSTGGYNPRLFKVVGAGTPVNVSPSISGEEYAPLFNRGIAAADDDPNTLFMVGITDFGGSGTYAAFVSHNGGASWVTLEAPTNLRIVYGVNATTAYFVGISGAVKYYDGTNLLDISIPGGGNNVALMGA